MGTPSIIVALLALRTSKGFTLAIDLTVQNVLVLNSAISTAHGLACAFCCLTFNIFTIQHAKTSEYVNWDPSPYIYLYEMPFPAHQIVEKCYNLLTFVSDFWETWISSKFIRKEINFEFALNFLLKIDIKGWSSWGTMVHLYGS